MDLGLYILTKLGYISSGQMSRYNTWQKSGCKAQEMSLFATFATISPAAACREIFGGIAALRH
jgi:hypothetical protein